jgi:hypothetical protein
VQCLVGVRWPTGTGQFVELAPVHAILARPRSERFPLLQGTATLPLFLPDTGIFHEFSVSQNKIALQKSRPLSEFAPLAPRLRERRAAKGGSFPSNPEPVADKA